jgi:hypothetical protein
MIQVRLTLVECKNTFDKYNSYSSSPILYKRKPIFGTKPDEGGVPTPRLKELRGENGVADAMNYSVPKSVTSKTIYSKNLLYEYPE